MMKYFYQLFYLFMVVLPLRAAEFHSGPHKVQLLEVYSSQGCSSCPPAQRWVSSLSHHSGLWSEFIPVVFHVDYWDYLGWKDPYSSAEFSSRQQAYKQQSLSKGVYTPGFIYAGREWKGWFAGKDLPLLPTGAVDLSVNIDDQEVKVIFQQQDEKLLVNVALLGTGIVTEVKGGENRSLNLQEDFIVLGFQQQLMNKGSDGSSLWQGVLPKAIAKAPRYALAVWVSKGKDLTPLQATGGWLD
jgi:hypothetical protein